MRGVITREGLAEDSTVKLIANREEVKTKEE
jgi:hypothetical protein